MAGTAKVLEKYEQAIIDACTKTGNFDFFYTAPVHDGNGFDPLYYLLSEPRNTRRTRRNRIVAKLKLYGYNKDGSKIIRKKYKESNETVDNNNNSQAIPPPNPPLQQNNNNRVVNIESRDKDGSEIVCNKDNNSNNNNNNNVQALPPTNPPTQQNENDKNNNLWLLAEAAAGCRRSGELSMGTNKG